MTAETLKFNRAEYLRLPEGFPAQLIEGQLVRDPAPVPWHQAVVREVYEAARRAVDRHRILVSPVDLFLDDHNILQPDVLVLPRGRSVTPADREVPRPDLVVEVLSPSSSQFDRQVKSRIYLEAGIPEVWIVDPASRTIEVRTLSGVTISGSGGSAASGVVDGFSMEIDALLAS